MRNTLETRLGMFFALVLIAAVLLLELTGGVEFFRGGKKLHVLLSNAQELKVDDPVKMAGVIVGRVEGIDLRDNKVDVVVKIKRGYNVRTDSKASIRFAGLMGQNYVYITMGQAKTMFEDGNTIEAEEQADLNLLMTKLDHVATGVENVTKGFSGDSINNLLGPLIEFVKQNSPQLSSIITNMQLVSAQVALGQGTVGKLIRDDTLHLSAMNAVSNLNAALEDYRTLASQARTAVTNINTGQGSLGKLLTDEALYKEAASAMTNLKAILEKINKGQGSVGKLVNDESLMKNAKMTLQKIDKATEGLEDQGPLSILGMALQSLF